MSQHNGQRLNTSNLILYFDIDNYNGGSTWNNYLGYNHGSISGSIQYHETGGEALEWRDDDSNFFLYLDGSGNYIELEDYPTFSEITINALVAPLTLSSESPICAFNNTSLRVDSTSIKWYPDNDSSAVSYNYVLPSGRHTHIAISHNSANTAKIYINGELKSTQSSVTALDTAQSYKTLAKLGSSYFNGAISKLIVHNSVLSDSEIASLNNTYQKLKHTGNRVYNPYQDRYRFLFNTGFVTNGSRNFKYKDGSGGATRNVDYGDGYTNTYNSSNILDYTYDEEGTYVLNIESDNNGSSMFSIKDYPAMKGYMKILKFPNSNGRHYITTYNMTNLTKATPPSATLNMANQIFIGATNFNDPAITGWNVSNVQDMQSCFYNCTYFDQPIGNWNTSSVTNMNSVFQNCSSFNQDLSNWDTSNVTSMYAMFAGCRSLGSKANFTGWDTSKVTNMSTMFQNCYGMRSPSGLADFDTSSVTSMSYMFQGANFLENTSVEIGNWDVSNVTNLESAFHLYYRFNTNLSNWNTSSVTNLKNTFLQAGYYRSDFSPGVSGWNVSNVTNMYGTFYNSRYFNEDLSSWNTSNVTSMSYMFYQCGQVVASPYYGVSGWDVSSVQTMYRMFEYCTNFDEDLGNWNLAGLNNNSALARFMINTNGLSTTNYDSLLNGWNSNKLASANGVADWRTDQQPHFSSSKYTSAASGARQALINYGWTITDGGLQT